MSIGKLFIGASLATAFFAVLGTNSAHAAVQTCNWTGTAGDNKFSTAGNWSNCGSSAPQSGDVIRFPGTLAASVNLVNDLNVPLGGIVTVPNAQNSPTAMGFVYVIDKVELSDGAGIQVEDAAACDRPTGIKIGQVSSTGSVTVNTEAIYLNGPVLPTYMINGALSIENRWGLGLIEVKVGSTAAEVIVKSPHVYSPTCVDSGGRGAMPNEPFDYLQNISYNKLTLEKGSVASFGTSFAKPLTVGGGIGTTPAKVFYWPTRNEAQTASVPTSVSISGPITLNSDLLINVGDRATASITGVLTGTGKISKSPMATGTLLLKSTDNTSATSPSTVSFPATTTTITDSNTNAAIIAVENETVTLTGKRAGAYVAEKAILKGSGTLTGQLFVEANGTVAPGNSPGCLTAGTLILNGDYTFEIGGTDPCTGYDQIKATDTAAPNSVSLDSATATLTTARYKSYTPKQNQFFTIIDNQGPNQVLGTFKDLAEGATFEQDGIVFKISYKGGDGNDVTLTVQNVPTVPNTGGMVLKANPALIAAVSIAGATVLAGAARLASKRR
ncbi:hypothetical protein KC967_02210 [Candidatus Saccharibacteria bacterium]|nr:hypothetical protein [Candidatus Saccharibacteria bacterium]